MAPNKLKEIHIEMTTQPSIEENIAYGFNMTQLSIEENIAYGFNMTQLSIEENIAYGFNMMTTVEDSDDYI